MGKLIFILKNLRTAASWRHCQLQIQQAQIVTYLLTKLIYQLQIVIICLVVKIMHVSSLTFSILAIDTYILEHESQSSDSYQYLDTHFPNRTRSLTFALVVGVVGIKYTLRWRKRKCLWVALAHAHYVARLNACMIPCTSMHAAHGAMGMHSMGSGQGQGSTTFTTSRASVCFYAWSIDPAFWFSPFGPVKIDLLQ